jgi:hypothetical protein
MQRTKDNRNGRSVFFATGRNRGRRVATNNVGAIRDHALCLLDTARRAIDAVHQEGIPYV